MSSLYRKRIIPNELILLDDDIILEQTNSHIITSWKTFRFKPEFAKGLSFYDLTNNIKVSKFMNNQDELVYWYCDILKITHNIYNDAYTFTDLLADVIIYPDNSYKVVDLDELSEALSKNLISLQEVQCALTTLNNLLQMIYNGDFKHYQDQLNKF